MCQFDTQNTFVRIGLTDSESNPSCSKDLKAHESFQGV